MKRTGYRRGSLVVHVTQQDLVRGQQQDAIGLAISSELGAMEEEASVSVCADGTAVEILGEIVPLPARVQRLHARYIDENDGDVAPFSFVLRLPETLHEVAKVCAASTDVLLIEQDMLGELIWHAVSTRDNISDKELEEVAGPLEDDFRNFIESPYFDFSRTRWGLTYYVISKKYYAENYESLLWAWAPIRVHCMFGRKHEWVEKMRFHRRLPALIKAMEEREEDAKDRSE